MMNYKGVIIEESLENKEILNKVKIIKTKVEQVTEKHKTPWLQKWTLHTVEIPEEKADEVSKAISSGLDYSYKSAWYADYKNNKYHFIIFKDKIFRIKLNDSDGFREAKEYGISLGIPEYQVDFAPEDMVWER